MKDFFSKTIKLIKEKIPVHNINEIKKNLKNNWYFPFSAVSFFYLNKTITEGYTHGILITFILTIIISSQIPSIDDLTKNNNKSLKLFSVLSAIGICLENQITFYPGWNINYNFQFTLTKILFVILSIPFLYFFILQFWNNIIKIIKENKIFKDIKKLEWIIYSILLIISILYMAFAFSKSQAFYGTNYDYDIIYTSDSTTLIKDNSYLSLTHPENDIRQPLFAVFSAPFVSIIYLITYFLKTSMTVQTILINIIQILLLFITNFLLTKILNLNSTKRICFMVLSSFTYTQLLFTLVMEQYIIAYFWLILCIFLIVNKKSNNSFALIGASGTLLTTMILFPLMSNKSPIKQFKLWFIDMFKHALNFIGLFLLFCRFDIIVTLVSRLTFLSSFTGKYISLTNRIYQYTEFIKNCFIAPNASTSNIYEHISWQLNPITKVSTIGIIILLIVIISVFINRKNKSSLLAAGWIVFSIIMLLILGWGTQENGLILYSLYFGWAYFVLIFQLIEKIENKLKVKFLIPLTTIITSILLLIINVPAIIELIKFAITNYPV